MNDQFETWMRSNLGLLVTYPYSSQPPMRSNYASTTENCRPGNDHREQAINYQIPSHIAECVKKVGYSTFIQVLKTRYRRHSICQYDGGSPDIHFIVDDGTQMGYYSPLIIVIKFSSGYREIAERILVEALQEIYKDLRPDIPGNRSDDGEDYSYDPSENKALKGTIRVEVEKEVQVKIQKPKLIKL